MFVCIAWHRTCRDTQHTDAKTLWPARREKKREIAREHCKCKVKCSNVNSEWWQRGNRAQESCSTKHLNITMPKWNENKRLNTNISTSKQTTQCRNHTIAINSALDSIYVRTIQRCTIQSIHTHTTKNSIKTNKIEKKSSDASNNSYEKCCFNCFALGTLLFLYVRCSSPVLLHTAYKC